MAHIIRKIAGVRWTYTYPEREEDFPADPLGDLVTEKDTLSVFLVDDINTNLEDIELALAINRKFLKPLEYTVLKLEDLEEKGFSLDEEVGKTKIETANNAHRNIVKLTADKLVVLAKITLREIVNKKSKYIAPVKVKQMINKAIESGKIKKEDLDSKLADKL